jgi:hypothetical protein
MGARTDHYRAGLVGMRGLNGTVDLERDRPWSLESWIPESSRFGGSVRFVDARRRFSGSGLFYFVFPVMYVCVDELGLLATK